MAYPSDMHTGTTLASFIPEIWGSELNVFYKAKLVLGNFFVDRSSELADGGNILYTPNLTEMSANAKTDGTAVTLNNNTDTKITLTVNQHYEVSFVIEDIDAAQIKRSYSIMEESMKGAAYTLASLVDTAIGALFASYTSSVGTSTSAIVDSDIRKAIGILEDTGVDLTESAFFFDTKVFWNQVMGLDKFALYINTGSTDPVNDGGVGKLYDVPVYRSNKIAYVSSTTGRVNALATRNSINQAKASLGIGSEGASVGVDGIRLQANYVPEYLGTLVTADVAYGVAMNRPTGGVKIYTSAIA